MTQEQASEAILKELSEIGLLNVHICHPERCAINALTHNMGSVNVDFAVQGGRVIKICMFVHPDGLATDVQNELVMVGGKYKSCDIEFGNQGNGKLRKRAGVLYKLNTHVAWPNLTRTDIGNIGNTTKDFVGDVLQVLNKTIACKASSTNIKQPRKRPTALM